LAISLNCAGARAEFFLEVASARARPLFGGVFRDGGAEPAHGADAAAVVDVGRDANFDAQVRS
jgi:hypothetical protein